MFVTQFPPTVAASANGLFNFNFLNKAIKGITAIENKEPSSKSVVKSFSNPITQDVYLPNNLNVDSSVDISNVTEVTYVSDEFKNKFPDLYNSMLLQAELNKDKLLPPDSVTNQVYGPQKRARSASSVDETPDSATLKGLENINAKNVQSPFSIDKNNESVSTLSGELSVTETDLSLPGRNGLSFDLTRTYSSGNSNLFKKDVEFALYCACYITYTTEVVWDISMDGVTSAGYLDYNPLSRMDNGLSDEFTSYYNDALIWYQNKKEQENVHVSRGQYSAEKTYQLGGIWFHVRLAEVIRNVQLRDFIYLMNPPAYKFANVAKEKPYEQKLYPIGSGWTWDIPYIESTYNSLTLNLGSKGSYSVKDNVLVGYPWKDLTFAVDYSVSAAGRTSKWALKSITGINLYFDSDGRLIRKSDAYGNNIDFKYSEQPNYGIVLESITDAINNKIQFTYDSTGISIQQGAKTVRYNKTTNHKPARHPAEKLPYPYDTLVSVTNSLNRTTTYEYEEKNSLVKLSQDTAVNNPSLLLKKINYPTGSATQYDYEATPFYRQFGEHSRQDVYRTISRKDILPTGTVNKTDFTYHSDMGASYGQNISNFGSTVSNGESTITYDYRKVFHESLPAMYYTNSVTTTADDEKNVSTFQYDEARRISSPIQTTNTFYKGTQAGTSVTTKVSYDDYGNVLSSTDANDITTQYTYDSNRQLLRSVTQRIDASQTLTTMINRNAQGTVTEVSSTNQQGTLMSKTRYENIDSFGNAGKVIVSDDNRETIYENEYGYSGGFLIKQTVQVKNVDGLVETVVTRADYNPSTGNLTSFTDGNNTGSTRYEYDLVGRMTKVTNPDDSFATVAYNDAANEATVKDETGVTTRVKWDAIGQKVEEGIEDGSYRALQKMGYDALGRLQWSEGANQKRTNYFYDKFGRLIRTEFPNGGGTATVSYDGLNRTKTVEDATGVKSREIYDIAGQLVLTELNKGSGFERTSSQTYNYVGNVLTLSDFNWKTTTNSYDALGRLTGVQQPTGEKTSYKYSLGGNLIEHIYPDGNKVVKAYDELGRPIKETDPKSQESKTYYDKAGNVVGSKDKKGQSFTFVYNNRNHLLTKQAPDATVKYTYDAAGRRKSMEDSTGTTSYAYKLATGELEKVTFPDSKFISYTYNNQGLRSQMTDPFGLVLDYTYDDMSRLSNVKNGSSIEASYEYYNNSLLKSISQVNGVKSSYSYDGLRLSTLNQTKANGTVLHSYSYQWDLNGNIKQRTENQHGQTETNAFDYDASNRITSSSQFSELYAYDVRGNRQALQSNRDLLQTEETNYQYNASNQLVSAKKDAGEQIQYKYNGDGLMVERTEGTKTLRYYYDGVQIIAEATIVNGAATNPVQYLRGKGLIARKDAQGKTYYLQNGHGDVTDLRDSTGNVSLNQYKYDIWGGLISSQETVSNPFQYSGEYWDSKAGLQYLRARWYDPSMGRFITEDSYKGELTNPLSQNLYTYVHNNPLAYIDPTGNVAESKELFNINLQLNQYKANWSHFDGMYRVSQDNNMKNYYKGLRDLQSSSAALLRSENSHLTGLLKSSDSVQTVQVLEYNSSTIGSTHKEKITVRIDQNNTVYYALPRESDSTGELISTQSKFNETHGTIASNLIGELSLPVGRVGKMMIVVTGNGEVPAAGTKTTIASINQFNVDYFATFVTHNQKVVGFTGWGVHGIFDHRRPSL
ncbi:hypothetical protein M3223_13385 [Paenibacillus pasadenensis]|nr:hypothetical protein [Paenibacillus pasadenensis]